MKKSIPKKILRQFGFLIAFVVPILIGWIIPSLMGHSFRSWTLVISLPTFFITIINPSLLHYPYKSWMKLGDLLGTINSNIILGIVFIFILLPISFIMKIFGYDPLQKRFNNFNSYKVNKKGYKIDFTKIF